MRTIDKPKEFKLFEFTLKTILKRGSHKIGITPHGFFGCEELDIVLIEYDPSSCNVWVYNMALEDKFKLGVIKKDYVKQEISRQFEEHLGWKPKWMLCVDGRYSYKNFKSKE